MQSLTVRAVDGRRPNADGEVFDEFAPLDIPWKEPGVVYGWLSKHTRMLGPARRRGYVVCNVERDFLSLGCPEEDLPGEPQPDGSITFGDTVLAKIQARRYSQLRALPIERAKRKRRAGIEGAFSEGDRISAQLGDYVKGNIVTADVR